MRESSGRDSNIFKLWSVITMYEEWQNFEIVRGSITMQDEYVGFWSFPTFFRVLY